MVNECEKVETVADFIFLGSKITVDSDCSRGIKRCLPLGRKALTHLGCWKVEKSLWQMKILLVKATVSPVELDHKKSWVPKNWCFQILVLEKTLESPLDCKVIKSVKPKGNQPWIFIGRTHAEAPIFWPRNAKSWLIEKDPNAGKDCRQEEKGTTEDEMVGWYYRLNGHEFEQTPGDSEGEAWRAAVHGVTKSQTRLSDWTTAIRLSGPWIPFLIL